MKFISVWPSSEKDKLDWDDFSEDELDDDYIILICEDYNWQDIKSFKQNAKPGDFVFILGEGDLEGIIFKKGD